MSEGTVGRWLKKPGDAIAQDEVIAEIETDKATMELVSYENGTLQKIVIPEGQTVPIGEIIAIIGDGPVENGQAAPAPAAQPADARAASPTEEGGAQAVARTEAESRAQVEQPAPAEPSVEAPERTNGQATGERVKASPLARRLAEEYGIDLSRVHGTGPGGRILKENVEEFHSRGDAGVPAQTSAPAPETAKAPAPQPTPQPTPAPAPAPRPAPAALAPAGEVIPFSRMRRAIARAMNESKPGVPHIYITSEVDMAEVMKLRKQINDSGASDVKISVNDMVVKAVAKALVKFPQINSSYAVGADNQPGVIRHPQVNVSVAVAIEDGLTAPVVRDADKKSLGTIAAEIRELAGRAREGKSKQTDLEGATFQVSNLGMFDVVDFVSIITVPQAASLSVGAVRQTPVVRDGEIVVGEMMYVTLSVDHRVADGATAAQYLQELKRLLQSPMSLLV
jgi:pyruvate dehydrogenase E2 component (dihydrolipoamide acetyltransferase)